VYVLTGSTLTLDYVVSNTGNVALTNLIVKEGTTTVCTIPNLAVSATDTNTCRRTITAQAGQQSASASVTATPPGGLANVTSDPDWMYYFGATININFVKRTNGEDAKTGTGPLIPVGGAVNWTYTVTSNSNLSLPFTVVDNPPVAISCPKNTLNPTDTVTCTASGTAVAGQYANTATLTVTTPGSLDNIIRTDTSHYYGVITGINIEKLTNGFDADQAPGPLIKVGEVITWSYVITNTGNVDLTGVSVVDDQEGAITTCPTTLALGATVTCTKMDTAEEGQYSNEATVTGKPPAGFEPVTDSDRSHYYGSDAGVSIKKLTNGVDTSVSPPPYIMMGDPVSWTYQVTNIGLYSITGIKVTDSDETLVISCPGTTLVPGAAMVCTASSTAKAGVYTNRGYVVGTPEGLEGIVGEVGDSDESGYFGVEPLIEITKTTNGEDAKTAPGPLIKVGEMVTWSYEITNTGNVGLTGISVVDDKEGPITCPSTSLAVGIMMTCSAQGTAIAGQYANNVTVTADTSPPEFGPVSNSDRSHYFGGDAGVTIKKLTNGVDTSVSSVPTILVGQPVNWTYEVNNIGNLELTGVTVTDSDETLVVSCPGTTLAIGATMTCTANGTAVPGAYSNTGFVEATPAGFTETVQNSHDSGYIGANPLINITKYINDEHFPATPGLKIDVGEPLTFTYQVSNPETLYRFSNVVVTDDSGLVPVCPKTTLNPGENMTCSVNGEAVAGQQSHAGRVTAKVLVHASGVELGSIQNSSMSYYFGETETGFNLFLPLILR
jgi:hypothetical protein